MADEHKLTLDQDSRDDDQKEEEFFDIISSINGAVSVSSGQDLKSQKERLKTGDQLIPKTSFKPIAAPGKLHGLQVETIDELLDGRKMDIYEDLLRVFVAAKTPATLWGPVGAGKTRTVESFANETDENGNPYNVITIQPSTTDPTSIHGLLTIDKDPRTGNKVMNRAIPEPAFSVWEAFNDKDQLTVMFLDEMTTCTPSQQQALLGLLTHGKYGDMDISPYVTFVMAANPPGTVDAVQDLEQSVINRGAHIPWYVERDVFIDKWSTGFGNRDKQPSDDDIRFIRLLIEQDPDIAFRDDPFNHDGMEEDMWRVDRLCPYDRMHFSARMVEELAKSRRIISDSFAGAPYDVQRHYMSQMVRAFVGPRWEKHAQVALDTMNADVSTDESLAMVNNNDISFMTEYNEIVKIAGDRLHRNVGKIMRAEQEKELAEKFEKEIFAEGGFRNKLYIAFWLWLSTSQQESTRRPVMPYAVNIMQLGHRSGEIRKENVIPKFVPNNIRKELQDFYTVNKQVQNR